MNDAAYAQVLERFSKGDTPPPGMALKPGTVATTTGLDMLVVLDGDTAATPVLSLMGGPIVGQRVMVLFWPPHGAYAVGGLGGTAATTAFEPLEMAEPGNLVVASGLSWTYVEYDSLLAPWRFTLGTAPTGASVKIDVLNNGVSVFSVPAEIPIGQRTVLATPSNPLLLAGDELTVDVLQIGSGAPGSYLHGKSRYYAAA